MRVGIPVADFCAGLFAALGIQTALLEREKFRAKASGSTPRCCRHRSFMLDFQAARWLQMGEVAKQAGNDHPTTIPTSVFKTADGYINIAAAGQAIWERLCNALGAPELIANPGLQEQQSARRNTALP